MRVSPALRRTPLFALHEELGAKLVPFAGWEMPIQYSGIKHEHQSVRSKLGLFDVSHMGELEIRGPAAVPAVNALITNDLAAAGDGQALYTCCCNDQGGILDDLIVYRLHEEHVLVVCNASNRDKISAHLQRHLPAGLDFTDSSDETALLAVQGPLAVGVVNEVLRSVDGGAQGVCSDLLPFRTVARRAALRGGEGDAVTLRFARTGYTGEDGLEIFSPNTFAPQLARALIDAGAVPCGLAARDTLRLEAALCLYGNDITEATNPLEARLSWTVKFGKSDFVGKAALQRARDAGLTRQLVGFEMTGRGIARHDYPLLDERGDVCGVCTSGSPSPTLDRNIGLGYLPVELSKVGSEFQVDCRGKNVSARVVKTPFYRRAKSD